MGNTVDISLWSMLICYLMAAGIVTLFMRLNLDGDERSGAGSGADVGAAGGRPAWF